MAATIRDAFDQNSSCYRIGGDEFYVLYRGSDLEKVRQLLKSMTDRLSKERALDSALPTVAYGICSSHENNQDIQAMLKAADAEMYCYKLRHKETMRSVNGMDESASETEVAMN